MAKDDPRPRYLLVGQNHELEGRRFPVADGLTLGRSVAADVFLPDPTLGRRHCSVAITPQGLVLEVCSYRAEVKVNQATAWRQTLRAGDVLTLGRFQLRLELESWTMANSANSANSTNMPMFSVVPAATTEENSGPQGLILAAGLRAAANDSTSPLMAATLLAKARKEPWAENVRWCVSDPLRWLAVWSNPGDVTQLFQAALSLQHLAWTMGSIPLCLGLANGPYGFRAGAAPMVWGEAVDQALRLLHQAPHHGVFMESGLADNQTLVRVTGRSDALRLLGATHFAEGRRLRFTLALPSKILHQGRESQALLIRLAYDRETQLTLLTFLSATPLESSEEHLLCVPGGSTLLMECRTCHVLPETGAYRIQAFTMGNLDAIADCLGLEIPSKAEGNPAAVVVAHAA